MAIGVAAYFIIPSGSAQARALVDFFFDFALRFGRFTLLPLLFFCVATACFKLNENKMVFKTGSWTFGLILLSSLALMLLGLFSSLIVHLPRIPITMEKTNTLTEFSIQGLLLQLFPYSGFEALLNGAFLLPCFIFAGLAGAGASSERAASKTAFSIFDSMSRVCYNVMSFVTEIFVIGMIAIMCKWTLEFVPVMSSPVFRPMIILLLVDLSLVAFVAYPLVLHFFCHEPHPYRVLYASLCPFLVAFFSGDANLSLQVNMRHGKDSLGIKRRINSVTFPLFSIFARGGDALVMAFSFVIILRSYSPLPINAFVVLWIALLSFLLSFALGSLSSGGAFIAITVMCSLYGRGLEPSYLLLKEVAPILTSFAAGFNAITAMFASYIVAVKTGMYQPKELKHFI